jgi:glycine/D-amino acid oxidase-like deaminating enzyme
MIWHGHPSGWLDKLKGFPMSRLEVELTSNADCPWDDFDPDWYANHNYRTQPGRTNLAPDPDLAVAIRGRCAAVEPALGSARVLTHRVGLRPSRGRVRLERLPVGRGHVVHNYGHGGAGVTLSWGCAREVLRLVGG